MNIYIYIYILVVFFPIVGIREKKWCVEEKIFYGFYSV